MLDVGCGPGRLALLLAAAGCDVTGVDLDPAMIEGARANAEQVSGRRPLFTTGDVAALPLPDASQDVVVTTLSMHHWSDPAAGLEEIARVLRPGGRLLVWDARPGLLSLLHHHGDPLRPLHESSLRVAGVTSWRWPLGLPVMFRTELAK